MELSSPNWQARLAAVPLAALLAAIAGAAESPSAAPAGGPINVRTSDCGTPPRAVPAGPIAFAVADRTRVYVSVYLIDADDRRVYAEIPWLTPGHVLPLATTLGAGRYAIRCVLSDGTVLTTSAFAVTGTGGTQAPPGAVAGYKPLPDLDLTAPVTAYRDWVEAALPTLLARVRLLDADIGHGDLAAAKADWLPAHLAYERLGAAYNSFGDFDDEIDGSAGLLALESGLWHGASAQELRPVSQALVKAVEELIADFPSEEIDPGDLPLRAHEILENTLQSQLTGAADGGSGTGLATAYANTEGTREVLSVLTPLIEERAPGLSARLGDELGVVQRDLLGARDVSGTWTPVTALPAAQRHQLDADLGVLLEDLASVPNLLAPRTDA